MVMRSLAVFLLLLQALLPALAQQNDVPLQRDYYIDVERNASLLDAKVFSGLKPVIQSRADLTNVMGHRVDSTKYYYWFTQKLFKESLIIVKDGEFRLTIDPLFQFEIGEDLGDVTAYTDTNNLYSNTRGFLIRGDLGKRFSFQTMFHETQAILPQYIFRYMWANGAVPGQGRLKVRNRRILDHGWSMANISWSPKDWLNVQMGNGKHFVGHGYRSVLLSDNAITAPYVKFSLMTSDRRLQYTTWNTKLTHGLSNQDRLPTGDASESLFYWMRARFNHLALRLGRVDLGFFESTIFRNIDENGVLPFDPVELNPVIGVNTLLLGFQGENRSMVGVDMRVKLLDKAYVYGQFATDDPAQARYAWQAGFRVFDLLLPELHLQVEYNKAEPFMYLHDPAEQAHMHGGLPMAHPMGSYFNELVTIVEYGYKRYRVQGKVNLGTYNRDPSPDLNYGGNLYKPASEVAGEQGPVVQQLTFLDLNASYLLNQVTNMRIMLGFIRRDLPGAGDGMQSSYIYASFRTSLFNRYYDL